jgi:hypothetical protein
MAMTATIATNPADTAVTEQPVTMVLTISNSGSSPIDMVAVVPYVLSTGGVKSVINSGVSIGPINFGPGAVKTVNPSGTLVITFPVTFHAPSSGVLSTTVLTYDVGATCYSSDGSVFIPTADTITVNYAVTYPTSQQ